MQWNFTQPQKRNAFESVLMMLMKIEPIMQSDVLQKQKNKYLY